MARQRDIIDIEMWRDIPGFGGVYQASTHGRIRRLPRRLRTRGGVRLTETVILANKKPHKTTGYYSTILVDEAGRQVRKPLHWFICLTFHGPMPSPRHQVAHGDGCRTNNHYRNLRWATPKENSADRVLHGTQVSGRKHPCAKLTDEDVRYIRKNYCPGYGNAARMGRRFGVTRGLILNVVKRKTWKHIN